MWYCLILHPPQNIIIHKIIVVIICSLSEIFVIIIPSKIKQLLNSRIRPKSSLNLDNRINRKRFKVLFHLRNARKKKVNSTNKTVFFCRVYRYVYLVNLLGLS